MQRPYLNLVERCRDYNEDDIRFVKPKALLATNSLDPFLSKEPRVQVKKDTSPPPSFDFFGRNLLGPFFLNTAILSSLSVCGRSALCLVQLKLRTWCEQSLEMCWPLVSNPQSTIRSTDNNAFRWWCVQLNQIIRPPLAIRSIRSEQIFCSHPSKAS